MNSELEEVKALVDEMAVLWVTQEVIDLEGKDHSEAFQLIRSHPRFFAMIMTAWMSGRWYEQAVQRRSRFDPDPELLKDLEKEFPLSKVDDATRRMREGIWKLSQPAEEDWQPGVFRAS